MLILISLCYRLMILFPNAKINLGLYVLNKRPDGFHNLETCFYPVPWFDILEIIPAEKTVFTSSGNTIPGNSEDNLCLKAYNALARDFYLPNVHLHLHKKIPIGAGLGGGSSDAAFVCKLLNKRFELGLTDQQLENYVRPLGSDCAFFIQNTPILAHEKGDIFTDPGIISLKDWWIFLIHPPIHVATKDAYQGVIPEENRKPLAEILRTPVENWKNELVNDFEISVFKKYPEIEKIKSLFYENGAIYASMSGSGSSVFGLFKNKPDFFPAFHVYSSVIINQLS